MAWGLSALVLLLVCWHSAARAQSISTDTPLPPLQWINLSKIGLTGPAPPPLKDASIGYYDVGQTLLIFGGESPSGFPQSATYLLDLKTLVWRSPSGPLNLQGRTPSARSAASGGTDFAANSRHGHVVIGGKGADGEALSDVWEFDYLNEFWTQVNVITSPQPSPRYGASGGIDSRIDPSSNIDNDLRSTFYLAGGRDADQAYPLSDLWRFNISGYLSANIPDQVMGSWQHTPIGDLPATVGQAGTVNYQRVVAYGGCNTTMLTGDACAQAGSFVLDSVMGKNIAPPTCPAPRLGAALASNMNNFSGSFKQQAFMVLGLTNSSLWNDDKGLEKGEVAVLDVTQGTWTRVLPAGDPGSSGAQVFPSAREGAAILSIPSALVGSQASISDTIVFGGRDEASNYLSDIWLLRAYNGIVTATGQKWSGYGDGKLTSGVDANGAGVTLQYMTRCAVAVPTPSGSSTKASSTGPASPTALASPTATGTTQPSAVASIADHHPYNASVVHKLLSPISVVLGTLAIIAYRFCLPPLAHRSPSSNQKPLTYLTQALALVAYATGLAGFILSFLTIRATSTIVQRSVSIHTVLKTTHGIAGLVLFLALYGLIPFLSLSVFVRTRLFRDPQSTLKDADDDKAAKDGAHSDFAVGPEKVGYFAQPGSAARSMSTIAGLSSRPASPPPRRRVQSWDTAQALSSSAYPPTPASNRERKPSDTRLETAASAPNPNSSSPPARSFEVTNRPGRDVRQRSMSGLDSFAEHVGYSRLVHPRLQPRTLSDVSWLERRRSLNAVDELDYALSRDQVTPAPPTPATIDALFTTTDALCIDAPALLPTRLELADSSPRIPAPFKSFLHCLLQMAILTLSIFTLVTLWTRAPIAAFSVFLAWTIIYYAILIILAWHGRPRESILATFIYRLRAKPEPAPTAALTAPPTPRSTSLAGMDHMPFPTDPRGPYLHHPPYRSTLAPLSRDEDHITSTSHGGHRSTEEDSDGDEDEDERQRRIEDEMNRRDVFSIVTTAPKRRLWITNPS